VSTPALELRDIHKRFGTTVALDGACCTVRAGTVHALLGENGAGKTTLMRIAFGLEQSDAGALLLEGREVRFHSGRAAIDAGLGMVHQHFMLVPALTVAENAALGGRGLYRPALMAERIRVLGETTSLRVDPAARVRDLPVGAQQRAEILRALSHDARVLILDEPTAVLTPSESDELYQWMRRFADAGGTVVLITHKLREALAVADDVTVLRRGRTVLHAPCADITEAALVRAVIGDGEAPRSTDALPAATAGDVLFRLDDVSWRDARGTARVRNVSLTVRRGEILGVIGVEGSGQRELLRLLAGRLEPSAGRITRPGRVGFVPEDRLHDAVIPEMTLTENLVLAGVGASRGLIPWRAVGEGARTLLASHDVRATGPAAAMSSLSGGNQQKFVVGREQERAPEALVAENPVRGLDIRATARVLEAIRSVATKHHGAAVVFSSDLDEVLSLTRRVVACFDGQVTEVLAPADPADRTPYARALLGVHE
jgi:general nucleoside transport system ATP-binding protein